MLKKMISKKQAKKFNSFFRSSSLKDQHFLSAYLAYFGSKGSFCQEIISLLHSSSSKTTIADVARRKLKLDTIEKQEEFVRKYFLGELGPGLRKEYALYHLIQRLREASSDEERIKVFDALPRGIITDLWTLLDEVAKCYNEPATFYFYLLTNRPDLTNLINDLYHLKRLLQGLTPEQRQTFSLNRDFLQSKINWPQFLNSFRSISDDDEEGLEQFLNLLPGSERWPILQEIFSRETNCKIYLLDEEKISEFCQRVFPSEDQPAAQIALAAQNIYQYIYWEDGFRSWHDEDNFPRLNQLFFEKGAVLLKQHINWSKLIEFLKNSKPEQIHCFLHGIPDSERFFIFTSEILPHLPKGHCDQFGARILEISFNDFLELFHPSERWPVLQKMLSSGVLSVSSVSSSFEDFNEFDEDEGEKEISYEMLSSRDRQWEVAIGIIQRIKNIDPPALTFYMELFQNLEDPLLRKLKFCFDKVLSFLRSRQISSMRDPSPSVVKVRLRKFIIESDLSLPLLEVRRVCFFLESVLVRIKQLGYEPQNDYARRVILVTMSILKNVRPPVSTHSRIIAAAKKFARFVSNQVAYSGLFAGLFESLERYIGKNLELTPSPPILSGSQFSFFESPRVTPTAASASASPAVLKTEGLGTSAEATVSPRPI